MCRANARERGEDELELDHRVGALGPLERLLAAFAVVQAEASALKSPATKTPAPSGWSAAARPARAADKDGMSMGRGTALRQKAAAVAGTNVAPPGERARVEAQVGKVVNGLAGDVEKVGLGQTSAPKAGARGSPVTTAGATKQANDAKVAAASSAIDTAVRDQGALEATTALNQQLASVPPELRGQVLQKSEASLGQLTEKVTGLKGPQTAQAVKNLAQAAELAGPLDADKLTGPMAKAMADGRLEQKGADADGGGGLFKNANVHNSEREFVDGVAKLGNTPGAQLFKDSLTTSLSQAGQASQGDRANRAQGMAAAVATGQSSLVPDKGFWTGVRTVGQDALGQVGAAASRLEGLREKAVNTALDKTLGIPDSLKSLQPGDSLTVGADVAVDAGVGVEAGGKVEVKRNDDGTYTAKGSAAAMVGLKGGKTGVTVGGGGQASGGLRLETRLPISSSPSAGSALEQAQAIFADPSKLPTGLPTTTATLRGSVEAEGHGIEGELKLQNLTPAQAKEVYTRAKQGDLTGAAKVVGQSVTPSWNRYETEGRGWADNSIDLGLGGLSGTNSIHHVIKS